jgi:hypothetical protein
MHGLDYLRTVANHHRDGASSIRLALVPDNRPACQTMCSTLPAPRRTPLCRGDPAYASVTRIAVIAPTSELPVATDILPFDTCTCTALIVEMS